MYKILVIYLYKFFIIFLFIFFYLTNFCFISKQFHIAISSNFSFVFDEICCIFEKKTNIYTISSSGSTGSLCTQIINGSFFDCFFSADMERPMFLQKNKMIVDNFFYTYASGRLVLWSKNCCFFNLKNTIICINLFTDTFRIVLTNSNLSPYGCASAIILKKSFSKYLTLNNIIYGENVGQSFNFVLNSNIGVGFSSLSQLLNIYRKDLNEFIYVFPLQSNKLINQVFVVLKTKKVFFSHSLYDFVKSYMFKKIVCSYGYSWNNDSIFL